MQSILSWDIYEITTEETLINGVMLRGRLRKLGLENNLNILCENASDIENCVRFAILTDEDPNTVTDYLNSITSDARVKLVMAAVQNPVLSKLKVNKSERYSL